MFKSKKPAPGLSRLRRRLTVFGMGLCALIATVWASNGWYWVIATDSRSYRALFGGGTLRIDYWSGRMPAWALPQSGWTWAPEYELIWDWPKFILTDGSPLPTAKLVLPLWTVLALSGLLTTLAWGGRARKHPPGHCQQCGYDLKGNVSGTCPECGVCRTDHPAVDERPT